ncbi:MAG: DUF1553 domain-containing protein, partial [Planctomycetota bacterium]
HDHKYDPITQQDYYALFAFFNNIDAQPETVGSPRDGLQPPFVSLASTEEKLQLAELDATAKKLEQQFRQLEQQTSESLDEDAKKELQDKVKQAENAWKKAKSTRDNFDRAILKAMVMKERSEVRPTFVMLRGQYDAPGAPVDRNAPAFLPALGNSSEVATRMDLANWMVSPENPLTARVAVNRFWQQFFGTGLVRTSEDLGAQGEVPSHPELLDYLSVSFQESGWDVKALVKSFVMSKTYRQSSKLTPEHLTIDPDNRLLARASRYRLDAEVIRDQILSTSGLLSKKMYGRSVKPPQPAGLWKSVTMTGERYRADAGSEVYRRSLYTFWKRAMPPPQMTILNAPNRDACIARRERTNTPSQALLLLNEEQYLKAARHLAFSVLESSTAADKEKLAQAFETITCQLPDAQEKEILQSLLADLLKQYSDQTDLTDELCEGLEVDASLKPQVAAWTVLVNALYNLDITKNRE